MCLQSSDDSFTSAAARQASFSTRNSSEDVFQDAMSRAGSRPESFVTASGMSFPAQQQQSAGNQGGVPVSIPVGDAPQGTVGRSMMSSVLSNTPPLQNQPN